MQIRTAQPQDASEMARLLNGIISMGGTTAFRQPFDAQGIDNHFISPPRVISCFVAVGDAGLSGFQALEWSDPQWPGDDPLLADWAIIATYVDPRTHGQGIGGALFAATASAAKEAGVRVIDATIRKENAGGLSFYQSIGFADYRTGTETVSKRYAPA